MDVWGTALGGRQQAQVGVAGEVGVDAALGGEQGGEARQACRLRIMLAWAQLLYTCATARPRHAYARTLSPPCPPHLHADLRGATCPGLCRALRHLFQREQVGRAPQLLSNLALAVRCRQEDAGESGTYSRTPSSTTDERVSRLAGMHPPHT
jgi:hypothetical protein